MASRIDSRITQKYIRRYPNSKRTQSWAGRMVHIRTGNGVWRINGQGYTYADQSDAWILPFEEALKQVERLGPEKEATFLLARSPQLIGLTPTHRHVKRGTLYALIGIGKIQAGDWGDLTKMSDVNRYVPSVDMREVAIYRSVDDESWWVRPKEEFEDGRFEKL